MSLQCMIGASGLQGRLIDHLRNTQSVGLEDLQALVLDEADRLLEMGFAEEVSILPLVHACFVRGLLLCVGHVALCNTCCLV